MKSGSVLCGVLFFSAAAAAFGQAGTCAGITPGFNVVTGGSFNGFVPWTADSAWHEDISAAPVDSRSPAWIENLRNTVDRRFRKSYPISTTDGWWTQWEGFPFHVVGASQQRVEVRFPVGSSYPEDSDPGPYPVPAYPRVQGAYGPYDLVNYAVGGDKHVIVVDKDSCLLYELWDVRYTQGKILAGTAAVYDMLAGDHQRPYFKTGGTVAGVPVMAGAIRYDEIAAGEIKHALAFTAVDHNQSLAFTGMATHHQYRGGDWDANTPPFGVKLRLRAGFNITHYTPENQIVLRALKKYGMVMVDGGLAIDLFTTTDKRWDHNSTYQLLTTLFLTNNGDFQAIQTGPIYCDPMYHCGAQPPAGPLPAIASFTANRSASKPGAPVTLSWSVSGVPSRIRFITPDIGPVVTSSVVVRPLKTTTYTLMVQNVNGRTTKPYTVVVTPSGQPLSTLYVGARLAPGASSMRVNVHNPDGTVASVTCASSPCAVGVDAGVTGHTMQIQHLSAQGSVVATSDVIPVTLK